VLQFLIETIIEGGLQAIGWAVLKVLTFGRYQGFTSKEAMREGALGLGTLIAVGYLIYRLV
jgi:hypothetical protein